MLKTAAEWAYEVEDLGPPLDLEDVMGLICRVRDEALEEAAEVAKKCSGCGGREMIGEDVALGIRALKEGQDISVQPPPPPPARP